MKVVSFLNKIYLPETMSDVSLLRLVPAEGCEECEHPDLLPGLQLLLVDVVLALVPAAEAEQGRAHRLAADVDTSQVNLQYVALK